MVRDDGMMRKRRHHSIQDLGSVLSEDSGAETSVISEASNIITAGEPLP